METDDPTPFDEYDPTPFDESPRSSPRGRSWQDRIRPVLMKIQPATRMLERAAQIAVHLQKPSAIGMIGMVSSSANALREYLNDGPSSGHNIDVLCSRGYLIDALRKAGAQLRSSSLSNGNECVEVEVHGVSFRISGNGSLYRYSGQFDDLFLEWFRQILDGELPAALEIRPSGDDEDNYQSVPKTLTRLRSVQGQKIWQLTEPMIRHKRPRCILLIGRPGVGKSTMAEEIAQLSSLGRVVHLDPSILGSSREESGNIAKAGRSTRSSGLAASLSMLTPGVTIVDDIDKIYLSLTQVEALRTASRLVILTANNGRRAEVLDGATMRPARIDEVFEVEAEHTNVRAPFDQLTPEEWERVRDWPIAYLNEVEVRLIERPGNVRLDDLEQRVNLQVRSGSGIY